MIMKREGLTITMIFLAESANYGEGIGILCSSLIGIQLRWMEKAELYSLHHLQLLKITPKLICLDT